MNVYKKPAFFVMLKYSVFCKHIVRDLVLKKRHKKESGLTWLNLFLLQTISHLSNIVIPLHRIFFS